MYQKELKTAILALKTAEKTFRRDFGRPQKIRSKAGNPRDIVTDADRKIEKEIKGFLQRRFPGYGFIGEESGQTKPNNRLVWVLDPIDGTSNYLRALPDCAMSLALLQDHRPVLGVVSSPVLKKLYLARAGRGSMLNGRKIRVSKTKRLKAAIGVFGWGKDPKFAAKYFPRLVSRVWKLRVAGSVALAHCSVAEGGYDFFCGKPMPIWDSAAGELLVKEAGGKIIKHKNIRLAAANQKLGRELQQIL